MCRVVGQPPAVQRRLVHRGDEKLVVRAEHDAEMRAGPFQEFRLRRHVGKPQRHAVVMRDREPQALRRERQPADGRGHVEAIFPRPCRSRTKAVLPADHATAPSGCSATLSIQRRFGIGREHRDLALGVERDDLAVVAARDDALAVGGRRTGCRRHARRLASISPSRVDERRRSPRRRRRRRARRGNAPR